MKADRIAVSTVVASRPLTPEQVEPPEGYTAEKWAAMIRASQALEFGADLPQPEPKIKVPIPDVPTEYRNGRYLGHGRGFEQVPVPNKTYVIRCGEFVKIGMASRVENRLRTLEASNPYPLEVVAVLAGGRVVERSLHVRFAAHRHRDEWFREEGELAQWIAGGCQYEP